MKKPSALSEIFQFLGCTKTAQFFKSTTDLSLWEKKRVWSSNRRFSQISLDKNSKTIHIDYLYKTIGCIDSESYQTDIHKYSNIYPEGSYRDSYFNQVNEKIIGYELEGYVSIKENPKKVYIAEENKYYESRYIVTVKGLIINMDKQADVNSLIMHFCPLPSSRGYEPDQSGIYLVFENNFFVATNGNIATVNFLMKKRAYLILKNNEFRSANMHLKAQESSKIELTGNIFQDSNAEIAHKHVLPKDVICLENNILYRNDNISSHFKFMGHRCYFRGRNTVDNLEIKTDESAWEGHWEGYQNIDPQGQHAYAHKQMFMDLIDEPIKKNDKMQEARLRRELFKCEKAIMNQESKKISWQDRFILWWSSWISDYGISWFRPIRLLIYTNALLAFIVFHFFDTSYSWWFLFAEFFNPLSSLADMTTMKDSGLISSINILQKAVLAIFVYEIIKIFRRFSK